jgi:type VI secretion system secreted protein VgrG
VIQIPRIGQEVIVDFIEGDPDRPIITGRVYNAEQTPPYGLPGGQTQSGLKSRSSKNGSGANEIRMEDSTGAEQLYIHAEKDKQVVVKNDRTESVGHDEKIEIANDRTESVGNNESVSIGNDQSLSVGNDQSVTIGNDQTINVGNDRTKSVAKNEAITVGENRSGSVGSNESLNVGGSRSTTIAKSESLSVGEGRSGQIGKDDSLNVGKSFKLRAGDQIVLETGIASLTMRKDGTVMIRGSNIMVDGIGNIDVKAGMDIGLTGSKIKQN